ncbi:tetratricopeptide repeat protein [Altererythrobacter aquiaggeris]|uniref:tetratricopeptide repeat protein n=1 Tax=Aestuarierythrobacter aquiaggeris TaxID=1898396 RepID=UPI003017E933
MGLNIEEQKAVDTFRTEVVEPSMTKLVILDFWAEWCGPCKALTPVLEKVAAEYADKGVILAKINVDEQQFIAAQFQVKSIPTVYAMFQGQPVADLTAARSESQLRQNIDQLLEQLPVEAGAGTAEPVADIEPLLAMGEELLIGGDAERAASVFAQITEMMPDNAASHGGLVRSLVAAGQLDQARAAFEAIPEAVKNDPAVTQAKSVMDLASDVPDQAELEALRDAAASDPDNMDAQFAFANAAFAANARDDAADTLLMMVESDREWNDSAARAKLLQIFEAVGLEDEWVVGTRRRLSRILFG